MRLQSSTLLLILIEAYQTNGFFIQSHLSISSQSILQRSTTANWLANDDTETIDEDAGVSPTCDIPVGEFRLETTSDGPSDGTVHTLTINLSNDSEPLVFQTGKVGRQAAGAIMLTRGETVVYATASRDDKPKAVDFLPLSVDYQERFSSAGMTSGSYNKRDGRPAEHEILTCRLIDRPLRPLINSGWRHETQLLSWVLSYDGERSCDPLAITASATALFISDVPLLKPVAAVNVGYIDNEFVMNPTLEQMNESRLHMTIAGTKEGILMIEGAADFLPESIMIEAINFGHGIIQKICAAIEELGKVAGKPKKLDTIIPQPDGLQQRVDELFTERIDNMYALETNKDDLGTVMSSLRKAVKDELEEEFPEEETSIANAFKDLLCRRMFVKAKETGKRCDGRELNEIRRLDMEAGMLPRVHGSALFTRGETQSIATATLGDSGMRQMIDTVNGRNEKHFYLQYTFPPSCVGETGRVGAPGRREVGHGNLAERALIPTIPKKEDFPYTIRLESLITESNGSSSMASVCGGTLALMDAGVPIKSPIAGIAMGMLLGDKDGVSDENAVILSDILGTEDALGTMDFKVAGDTEGITTFQMDIKCEGLTPQTMERALEQARGGRLHLLDEMRKVLPEPRAQLPVTVPKMKIFEVEPDKIGRIIGPGGKQIRAIIEDFGLSNMDVQQSGTVQITSLDVEQLEKVEAFVKTLVEADDRGGGKKREEYVGPEPEVGKIYKGKITGIQNFGIFVEILPGAEDGSTPGLEGLCHVSALHTEHVRNCEGFVRGLGVDEVEVRYLGKDDRGRLKLSRKSVLEDPDGTNPISEDTVKPSARAGKYAGPDAVVGKTYKGKIMSIHNFGVFLEIIPGPEDGSTFGLEGLVHVSELHTEHVRSCEGFISSLEVEELDVRYLGKNGKNQVQLSRKSVLNNPMDEEPPSTDDEPDTTDNMSQSEIDVIATAIEGLSNQ